MLVLASIALGAALGSSGPVIDSDVAQHATACTLPAGARMFVVRYVDGVDGQGPLCDGSGRGACQLSGWLYRPSGKGPFPTIVLNHAGENPRKDASDRRRSCSPRSTRGGSTPGIARIRC